MNAQNSNKMASTDLNYQVQGKGTPIILIHGGGTYSRVWKGIGQELSKQHKVITYDLRGHGESPIPTDTTNHVEDLFQLFSALELNQATLIGHSLGGQIATDFALLYPKKVDRLVLLAPGLSGYQYDQAYQAMGQKMWQAVPNVDAMLTIMLNTPEAYAMQQSMQSSSADIIEQIHRDNVIKSLQWKNFEQEWPFENTADQLTNLKNETLFIVGTEDKQDIFRIKRHFGKMPNISFKELEGADHGLLITHNDELKNLIRNFMAN